MAARRAESSDNGTACSSSSRRRGGSSGGSGRLLCGLVLLLTLSFGTAQQQQQQGPSSSSGSSSEEGSGIRSLPSVKSQGDSAPQATSSATQATSTHTAAAVAAGDNATTFPSPASAPPAADDEGCPEGLSLRCLRSGAWLTSGPQAAEAAWFVIFIASPFAVMSIIALALGIVDIRYSSLSCSYLPTWTLLATQALLATFWTLLLPLAAYLVASHVLPMIVFLVFSCLAAIAHWLLLGAYIQRAARNRALEQPRQQLLTARDKADPKRVVDEEAPNPFNAPSLGVIPGTSNMGYILWLPAADSSREDSSMQPPTPQAHGYQAAPSPTELAGRASLEGRARLMPKPARKS